MSINITHDRRINYLTDHNLAIYFYQVTDPDLDKLFNDPISYGEHNPDLLTNTDDAYYALEDETGKYLTTGTAPEVVKFLDKLIQRDENRIWPLITLAS